ncbi:MAG: M48 family metallopeptidase [Burkholderiaceae bacterium]|nr:M48 family metallopeptidase [Burkholderiaceae bacterium]
MNFFEQQDQAHRQTKKLMFLFVLAVICITVAVNLVLALAWIWSTGEPLRGHHHFPHGFFLVNTGLTLLFIVGGTLVETFRLRDGGDAVAQMAGGRLVASATSDLQERRLLNIVEEMALASGVACPRVYVLDQEDTINAFAAGYHQNEAVVAVTRGTITRLTRDELQGVIGHEFSHILNGDMRLNIKLIGVLFGIQMIAGFGELLMEIGARSGSSRGRDDKGASAQFMLIVIGALLYAVGYIGIFFGRLIKSAVSRQREFLADASAVQFTRNADGIGGALRKIGGLGRGKDSGSRIANAHAEQFSHLFLAAARPKFLSGLFATHPPLEERLRRIYGRSVGMLDAEELASEASPAELPQGFFGFGARQFQAVQSATANTTSQFAESAEHVLLRGSTLELLPKSDNTVQPKVDAIEPQATSLAPQGIQIPVELLGAARDPFAASALVVALLLDDSDGSSFQIQKNLLLSSAANQCSLSLLLFDLLKTVPRNMRLPLLDRAMPALKSMSDAQRMSLLGLVSRLIAADKKVSHGEFVLQTVLDRRLSPGAERSVPVKFARLEDCQHEVRLLVGLVYRSRSKELPFATLADKVKASLPALSWVVEAQQLDAETDFFVVRAALQRLNQLAPLVKPILIRVLLLIAEEPISPASSELLQAICAAIDAPVPSLIAQQS